MIELAVHLKEGFQDDEVQIFADGQVEIQMTEITTDYSIGLAEIARIEIPDDIPLLCLEVNIPTKNLTAIIEINPTETPFLSAAIDDNQLILKPQDEDFIMF